MLKAIDETLSYLDESSRTALYYRLETEFNIKKDEIPNMIDDFTRALENLFGLGAEILEVMLMKSLNAQVRVAGEKVSDEWVVPEMTFKEYVDLMKRRFKEAGEHPETGILIDKIEE